MSVNSLVCAIGLIVVSTTTLAADEIDYQKETKDNIRQLIYKYTHLDRLYYYLDENSVIRARVHVNEETKYGDQDLDAQLLIELTIRF